MLKGHQWFEKWLRGVLCLPVTRWDWGCVDWGGSSKLRSSYLKTWASWRDTFSILCGTMSPLTHTTKLWLIHASYLCVLTCEHAHTHTHAERLMDMDCGLTWPLWAVFHTVIELHSQLGGGVRVGGERRKEEWSFLWLTFRDSAERCVSR